MKTSEKILSIYKILVGIFIITVSCAVTYVNIPMMQLAYDFLSEEYFLKTLGVLSLMILISPIEFFGFTGGFYLISNSIEKYLWLKSIKR